MNKQAFYEACSLVKNEVRTRDGIGTLGEKTVHAVLKRYYEPVADRHEIQVGGYVADIVGETGIIEIQTRQFERLRRKLDAFLPVCPVTVVYPIAHTKWLYWMDPNTGEMSNKRKSPKTGSPLEAFFELYKVKDYLCREGLCIHLILLDVEEYRNLDGWSHDRKKGSSRFDRVPVDLHDEIRLASPMDFRSLLPQDLPEEFTCSDLKECGGISLASAQTAMRVLAHIGAVSRIGKRGRANLYRR